MPSILPLLIACHYVGDYWVQTHWQATTKGLPGWTGRRACATHVLSYSLLMGGALAAVDATQHLGVGAGRLVAGLLVSAGTHYVADRRAPLRRLALAVGKDPEWLDNGGLPLLDQAWHIGWLAVAAAVVV